MRRAAYRMHVTISNYEKQINAYSKYSTTFDRNMSIKKRYTCNVSFFLWQCLYFPIVLGYKVRIYYQDATKIVKKVLYELPRQRRAGKRRYDHGNRKQDHHTGNSEVLQRMQFRIVYPASPYVVAMETMQVSCSYNYMHHRHEWQNQVGNYFCCHFR